MNIAIPSHRRSETLCKKTLKFLREGGISPDSIYLFVEPEEMEQYEAAIVRHHPDYIPNMCEGRPGTSGQRRAIEEFFRGGRVVSIDDDIAGIKMLHPQSLPDLFDACFRIADREGCVLWGVHPSDNGLSMRDAATVGLSWIPGGFYGMTVNTLFDYPSNLSEDFERSVQCYKRDGRVIRFNGVGMRTKCFGVGGLEKFREGGAQEAAMREFHSRFPHLCRLRVREGKPTDVVIKTLVQKRILHPFQSSD